MNPLIRYLSRRFFFFLITFFTFLLIIFTLPRAIPGNPLAQILYSMFQQAQTNPELIQAVYKQLMEEFGIGKPLHIQLLEFFIRLLHGDLGTSIAFYPRKVTELVFIYLPYTLGLLIPATLVSWIIGNLLGALAAYKRKSIIDNALLPIFLTLSQTPY